jgi:hypothetical protein
MTYRCPECGGETRNVSKPQVLARGTQFAGEALKSEARYGLLCDDCLAEDARMMAGLRAGTSLLELMPPGARREKELAREVGRDERMNEYGN